MAAPLRILNVEDSPNDAELLRIQLRRAGFAAVVSGAGPSVLVLADGPGRRLEATVLAESVTGSPWEALPLAVDFLGGTVRAAEAAIA